MVDWVDTEIVGWIIDLSLILKPFSNSSSQRIRLSFEELNDGSLRVKSNVSVLNGLKMELLEKLFEEI